MQRLDQLPDVLVLGGGGTLGEAWMRGVLSGIEAGGGLDFRDCEYLLGTSAGAIVAAALAGGRRPEAGDRAAREWARAAVPEPEDARRFAALRRAAGAAAAPLAPAALATAAPAGRLARAAVLRAAPRSARTLARLGDHLEALGARFDGRLRVSAVDRASGRRVMFGAPGAPPAAVPEAVLASCAVPWLFAPVEIDGREYVDGGVWSPTNLDAAPAGRGAHVLCLIPTAAAAQGALRTASTASARAEALALRARGVHVRTIVPDGPSVDAIGPSLMDEGRRAAAAAAGHVQGRRLAAT